VDKAIAHPNHRLRATVKRFNGFRPSCTAAGQILSANGAHVTTPLKPGDSSGPGALGEEAHAVESDDDGGSFVAGDAEWQG
jgi:hypothetical protein